MLNNEVYIYTDGSCEKNPGGNGGYGAIILDGINPIKLSGFYEKTTNQRMEIMATIQGMKFFKEKRTINIYTDSAYVCNCFKDGWYKSWIKNGWKTSTGTNVLNQDLWEEWIELIKFHDVKFHKVKGHSDNILNNECDKMARDIIAFTKMIRKDLSV